MPMSSSSCSTARSHKVTWSSAPDAAKIESSEGCHSIEVIGALCHEKDATGVGPGEFELDLSISHYTIMNNNELTPFSLCSAGPMF